MDRPSVQQLRAAARRPSVFVAAAHSSARVTAATTATAIIAGVLLVLLIGCGSESRAGQNSSNDTSGDTARPHLRIAEQHGLAYAPLALIQAENRLSETVDVEWIRVNNAAAIREAMLARRLDVGFMGIPPYLIGRDRETGWHAFTGLSRAPLGLVTVNPRITDLADLVSGDTAYRVALPQPGSIQHILLSMALDREFGDPTLLDDRLVSMGHPDGMNALLAAGPGSDIAAHFTSPPFLFEELRHPAARLLLSGEAAFGGEFTFIVGVLAPSIAPDAPAVAALANALERAMDEIGRLQSALRADPAPAVDDLSRTNAGTLSTLATFYDIPTDVLAGYLRQEGLVYEREIRGMEQFSDRMRTFGYVSRGAGDAAAHTP